MKMRGSDQLRTELAMYDQELDRDRVMPSNQRFEDSGKTTYWSDDKDAQLQSPD